MNAFEQSFEDWQTEQACARLCIDFARFVDLGEPALCAALFTEEGIYERRGETLRGRVAIEAALRGRSPQRVSRHLVHNLRIEMHGPDQASGWHVFTLYAGDDAQAAPGGVPVSPLLAPQPLIGEFADQFVRTAEGWRIAQRRGRTLFRPA